jgi:hypothetical protein
MRLQIAAAAAALALAGTLPSARAEDSTPAGSPAPQLAGRYKFNPEKSDDARAKMREAMDRRRSGFGGGEGGGRHHGGGYGGGPPGGMGGGGGMGGYHRRPGGPGSDEGRAAMRATMEDVTDPAEVLTITQKDAEVVITFDDGRVRRLFTDDRRIKTENTELHSHWEGEKLVSETEVKKGPKLKIREAWSIDPATHGLRATVRFDMPMSDQPVIVHRIYDVAPLEGVGVTVTPSEAPAGSAAP